MRFRPRWFSGGNIGWSSCHCSSVRVSLQTMREKVDMSKRKVIVTRRWPAEVEQTLEERYDTQLNLDDKPMGVAQLQEALCTADALLPTVSDKIAAEVLSADPLKAKILGNFGVGFNHIDL